MRRRESTILQGSQLSAKLDDVALRVGQISCAQDVDVFGDEFLHSLQPIGELL